MLALMTYRIDDHHEFQDSGDCAVLISEKINTYLDSSRSSLSRLSEDAYMHAVASRRFTSTVCSKQHDPDCIYATTLLTRVSLFASSRSPHTSG